MQDVRRIHNDAWQIAQECYTGYLYRGHSGFLYTSPHPPCMHSGTFVKAYHRGEPRPFEQR